MKTLDLTELYALISDLLIRLSKNFLEDKDLVKRGPNPQLSPAEIITISLLSLRYSMNFKRFYHDVLQKQYNKDFRLVSYDRFLQIQKSVFVQSCLILDVLMANNIAVTNKAFVDSSPMPLCKNARRYKCKAMQEVAKPSKNCHGWFYGLKIHLVTDDNGKILNFKITPANTDDRKPVMKLVKNMNIDFLCGDKGYISSELTKKLLLEKNISLITYPRKGMKNNFVFEDHLKLLRRRPIIETVFGQLKEQYRLVLNKCRSNFGIAKTIVFAILGHCLQIHKMII